MSEIFTSPESDWPAELALLILHHEGFVNRQAMAGTLLSCEGRAWRYQDEQLTPVAMDEYERALDPQHQADWPPYTISFALSELSAEQTLRLEIDLLYACGIDACSRGGNSSIWRVQRQPNGWRVLAIEAWMDSD